MKLFTEADDPEWEGVGCRVGATVHPTFDADAWYSILPEV
jgi:3-oxoacyl-[acyl-carrier-protein] synthase II